MNLFRNISGKVNTAVAALVAGALLGAGGGVYLTPDSTEDDVKHKVDSVIVAKELIETPADSLVDKKYTDKIYDPDTAIYITRDTSGAITKYDTVITATRWGIKNAKSGTLNQMAYVVATGEKCKITVSVGNATKDIIILQPSIDSATIYVDVKAFQH